ncbi:hypothetical protein BJ912DRAFT_1069019 [Pholiota molesta]|nr:hypothetical protein BJ912DRAFT_1069019 [Pholiota molesta]
MHSFFPEFAAQVEEHDPTYAGRNAKVTAWKQQKAAELIDEPLFEDLDPAETQQKWQEAIMRVFGNFFNSSIKRRKPTEPKKAAGANNRGLVVFTGQISPKSLFAMEHREAITTLYKSICAKEKLPGGAAKNKATSQLWEQADQALWEQKANDCANDIQANRGEFTDIIQEALQDMLATGSLGSGVISLSYAFRSPEDNGIMSGCVQASFDATTHLPLTEAVGDEFDPGEDYDKKWAEYARVKLPRAVLNLATRIPRNGDGLPLFPVFNLKARNYSQVTEILEDYFLALWEYTQEGSMHIPWNDIEAHPDRYYDTWDHQFPCRFTSPADLNPLELTTMAVYLTENTLKKPFTFYDKATVESNLLLAKHMDDAPAPPSPAQFHGDTDDDASDNSRSPEPEPPAPLHGDDDDNAANDFNNSPPPSPLIKPSSLSRSASPDPPQDLHGDKDSNEDENFSPPPSPLMKMVSPSRLSSPVPPPVDVAPQPSPPPAAPGATRQNEASMSVPPAAVPDATRENEASMPVTVPPAAVPDAANTLSVLTQLLARADQRTTETFLAALTAAAANSGTASEVHSTMVENGSGVSSNVEEVGKKRKRGRPAKIQQDATSASASTSEEPSNKPASTGRRTNRQCKPIAKGPVLVSDPSAPPPKKVKHGYHYIPVTGT